MVIALTLLVSLVLLLNHNFWKFWKKGSKKKEEEEAPKDEEQPSEQPLQTDFMVDSDQKKVEEPLEPQVEEKIYDPGSSSAGTYEPVAGDQDHIMGHEVQVKELPTPLDEDVDASWIEFDMSRDFNNIIKELERKNANCYEILGVGENASKDEIRKAYRRLANKYHPDKGNLVEGDLMERIREINYSKEILLDPTMRALHDEKLRQVSVESTETKRKFDASLLGLYPQDEDAEADESVKLSYFIDDDEKTNGLGVLFFRKWHEDLEGFGLELMDYFIDLDDQGYIDYGMVMKGDVDDMDDITKMRKVSNFPMAVNNSLFDIWVKPPFYYLAVPILKRDNVQEICDNLKESFSLESIFFRYPLI